MMLDQYRDAPLVGAQGNRRVVGRIVLEVFEGTSPIPNDVEKKVK